MSVPNGLLRLENVTVPASVLGQEGDLIRTDLSLANGRIVASGGQCVDMGGKLVLPCFVDMHTHLDKGHISPRTPKPNGTFDGAIKATAADRAAYWSAKDLRTRMDFALRCAYAHGTRAIRTHLDSSPPQEDITWPVFREVRADWAGRIDLQAVCLDSPSSLAEAGSYARTANIAAQSGGALGLVTFPAPNLQTHVQTLLQIARDTGSDVDFHVDETLDPDAETLRLIAQTVLSTRFEHRVTVGHCCSLSTQDPARAGDTLDLVAKAGLNVVSLPMCNLYLQDRHAARTPRYRGITLVHEMHARGINVSFASDNTRDPFYAYGDLDMLEVLREATRIGHLDHADPAWVQSVLSNPAKACGFAMPSLDVGSPADLIVFNARNWTELFARPQSDRIVLRGGKPIDRTLPEYSELDGLYPDAPRA